MTQIVKITNKSGTQVFPQTHTKAVIDDNGYTAESRLGAMQDEINQAQLAVGAVPSDLTPTEGSSNWVTSGGVYNAIQVVQSDVTELEGLVPYVYDDVKLLARGQAYEEMQNVKTSDKQLLRITKAVNTLVATESIAANTYWAYNGATYKATSAITAYNPSTTYTNGQFALGSPTVIILTVSAESPSAGNVSITVGTKSATIAVTTASTAASVASAIVSGIGTIDGWTWTDNSDGTLKLTCNSGGNNTLAVSYTDSGSTGVTVTSSTTAGSGNISVYNSGQWAEATLNDLVTSSVFTTQTENELIGLCEQNTVIQDINDKFTITKKKVNYLKGGYYNDKGTFVSNANYGYISDYIPITPGSNITFSTGTTQYTACIISYTSSKTYRSYWNATETPRTIKVAAGDYYVRISFPLSYAENAYIKNAAGYYLWRAVTPAEVTDVNALNARINDIQDVITFPTKHYTEGACFRTKSSFALTEDANYGYTDFWIPVTSSSTITWNTVKSANCYMMVANSTYGYSDRWVCNGEIRTIPITSAQKYIKVSFPLSAANDMWIKDAVGNIIWQPITYENVKDKLSSTNERIDSIQDALDSIGEDIFDITKQTTAAINSSVLSCQKTDTGFTFVGTSQVSSTYAYGTVTPLNIGSYYEISFDYTRTTNVTTAYGAMLGLMSSNPMSTSPSYMKTWVLKNYSASGTIKYRFKAISSTAYLRMASYDLGVGNVTLTNISVKNLGPSASVIEDIAMDVAGVDSDINNASTQGYYTGNKIPSVRGTTNRIGWRKICNSGGTQSNTQASAIYNGYLFEFQNNCSKVNIYNLAASTPAYHSQVTPTNITTSHANCVNFGNLKYDDNDDFPLLYVSGRAASPYNQVQVYRVTLADNVFTITQVQDLRMPDSSTWGQLYLDNTFGTMWYGNETLYKFKVPAIKDGSGNIISSVQLTSNDILDSFNVKGLVHSQGGCIVNGYCYIISGVPQWGDTVCMSVWDIWGRKIECLNINLNNAGWGTTRNDEPESISYYDGHLIVNTLDGGIYRLYI